MRVTAHKLQYLLDQQIQAAREATEKIPLGFIPKS